MDRFPKAPVAATYREAYTTKNISAKTPNPSNPKPYKPETLNPYNWQAQTERMIPTFVRAGNPTHQKTTWTTLNRNWVLFFNFIGNRVTLPRIPGPEWPS